MVREERDPAFWQAVADHPRFWIAGLPRSRTAWFAHAMRGPRSSCFHELTGDSASFDAFARVWTLGEGGRYRGNSDSACGLHIARILAEIQPRTLIVERPLGDVLASLAGIGLERAGLREDLETLQDALAYRHPLIKRVRFADLANRDAVVEAVEWLVPGHGEHAAALMDQNIQVSPARIEALKSMPHSMWHLKRAA